MIKTIEIDQFRGIQQLKLDGLRKLNIIVGPSASGKTALLEALRLAIGATPQTAFNLVNRGMPNFPILPNPSREQFESLWSSLFFNFRTDTEINLKVIDSTDRTAQLTIFFDQSKALVATQSALSLSGTASSSSAGQPSIPPAIAPLTFKRKPFTGPETTLHATVNPNGQLQFEQGGELGSIVDFLSPIWQTNPQQIAALFSQLSIANKTDGIVEALKEQFPQITGLSVQSPTYLPALYATLKHVARQMPLAMVSSGINKFVSLLLAVETAGSGVLLVDEVENGIYYQTMPKLWNLLRSSANQASAQLFLTTHSWECLKSVAPMIETTSEDFSLIQMYQEDGKSVAKVVPGEHAAAAIEAGIEVRA
ncbi:MAG: AAA family ATPase [Planctomycetes bacterium]|jgi:predicted ATPase|nr:AAA family ATPase [Planctomycetota bacterium]